MSDFATHDAFIAAMYAGQRYVRDGYKTPPTMAIGNMFTLWQSVGLPGAGADPAVGSGSVGAGGTAYTSSSGTSGNGGVTVPDQSSYVKRLGYVGGMITGAQGTLHWWDRIFGVSAITLSGATGTRNINSVALPTRSISGIGLEIWAELTTAATVTPVQMRINYTNTLGTGSRQTPTVTFPAAAQPVRTMLRFPLQAGDVGVLSLQTADLVVAGSAGVANILLLRPLTHLELANSVADGKDLLGQTEEAPVIGDGAVIMNSIAAGGASTLVHTRAIVAYA